MRRPMLIAVVLMLGCVGSANADPILYTMTGVINDRSPCPSQSTDCNYTQMPFTGSFVLSDPTIIYNWSNFPPDSPDIEDMVLYTLSDVTFRTDAVTLEGTGSLRLRAFASWGYCFVDCQFSWDIDGFDESYTMTREVNISGSILEPPDWIDFIDYSRFFQPATSAHYTVLPFTAYRASVPEPTSLLLLGMGLTGLAAWRRRRP